MTPELTSLLSARSIYMEVYLKGAAILHLHKTGDELFPMMLSWPNKPSSQMKTNTLHEAQKLIGMTLRLDGHTSINNNTGCYYESIYPCH